MTMQLDATAIQTELAAEQVTLVLIFTIVSTLFVTGLTQTATMPQMNGYLESLGNLHELLRDIFYHSPVHPAFSLDNLHQYRNLTAFLNQAGRNLVATQLNIHMDTASPFLTGYIRSCLESRMAFDFLSGSLQGYTEIVNMLSSLQ